MASFIIEGGHLLQGTITPQGAKNEALQVICATLLTEDEVIIRNIPDIRDVNNLIQLLRDIGVKVRRLSTNDYAFQANGQCSMADMQYQILPALEAVMVFRLDQSILRIVQECYPDVKVCCTDAQQLEHCASLQEKRLAPADAEQRDAYVCFDEKHFFVAVFQRSKLQYASSQIADNDSDRTFLLLGIWKALDMHAQRDVCHLEGASAELQKTIGEYILNIEN